MPTLDLLRQIAADARAIAYSGVSRSVQDAARRILANAETLIERESKTKATVEDGRD